MTLRNILPRLFICGALFSSVSLNAWADNAEGVWFAPDGDSPDLIDLFRQSELWSNARAHINVFKFGPMRLTAHANVKRNSFEELKEVDAFRKIHGWGIKIASEEGAIKPWDCTGLQAAKVTEMHIRNVHTAGGTVDVIAMDEPLSSGRQACHLPSIETARRAAAYVRAIESSEEIKMQGVTPMIGDIEPYPSMSVNDFEEWTNDLIADGFRPAFVHIDINHHFVDLHRRYIWKEIYKLCRLTIDERTFRLASFFGAATVLWNSDKAYYDHVMKLVHEVRKAVGRPDQIVFQSWVKRSPKDCQESDPSCNLKPCSQGDPPYCGEKSIPLNLPESAPTTFSHTRLINDALSELNGR